MKNLLFLLTLSFFSLPMFADIILPDRAACQDKKADESCKVDGKDGICMTTTCSRLDYSQGTPPRSVAYECLVCKPVVKAGEDGCSTLPVSSTTLLPIISLLLGLVLVGRLKRGQA